MKKNITKPTKSNYLVKPILKVHFELIVERTHTEMQVVTINKEGVRATYEVHYLKTNHSYTLNINELKNDLRNRLSNFTLIFE